MNEIAKNGFRTFILTLSVSLIIFSAIYYGITSSSPEERNFENSLGDMSVESVKGVQDESDSVFGEMVGEDEVLGVESHIAQVSTGTTTTTTTPVGSPTTTTTVQESTTSVPETGVFEITVGLFTSVLVLLFALYLKSKDPRKLALKHFEKTTAGSLD